MVARSSPRSPDTPYDERDRTEQDQQGGHTVVETRRVRCPRSLHLWTFRDQTTPINDEFIADGFRLVLMGNTLDLYFEALGTTSYDVARALAEKYVTALGKNLASPMTLITEEEFLKRTTPPFGNFVMTNRTASLAWEERGLCARAIKAARTELLADADPTLRQRYDYLQEAVEEERKPDRKPAYAVFKAMEVLKERFGSDGKAGRILGKVFEQTKQAARLPLRGPKKQEAEAIFGGLVQ